MIAARDLIGSHDVVLITFDSLRFDVAQAALERGLIPNLARVLPSSGWEARHTPGNFTFAAHQAFFAGFLPTPVAPGKYSRLFAAKFEGSQTTSNQTFVFEEASLPQALAARGYHTVCIGGVGFFNKQSQQSLSLTNLFEHSYWNPSYGVKTQSSTKIQVSRCICMFSELSDSDRIFLFVNISATHKPTRIFNGAKEESFDTQLSALKYADSQLEPLFEKLKSRGDTLMILCSDHGDAFGEDGYFGHRINHPVVTTVPYAEFILESE
jgi:arylsulfatase A-like enzyme